MRTVIKILYAALFCPFLISAQSIDTTKKGVIHVKKPASINTKASQDRSEIIWDSLSFSIQGNSYYSPSFPGGDSALTIYLTTNLRYPALAKEKGIEGIVNVFLAIDRNGSIKRTRVMKQLWYGCDEEALRLVREMPKWNPALNSDSQTVWGYLNLPITFKLK